MRTSILLTLVLCAILSLSEASTVLDKSRKSSLTPQASHSKNVLAPRRLNATVEEEIDHTDGTEDTHDETEDHLDEGEHLDETEEHHDEDEHGDHDDHASAYLDDGSKPWGAAIGAALIVNVATLIGVVCLVPLLIARRWFDSNNSSVPPSAAMRAKSQERRRFYLHLVIPSFALGALLATAVFLILPESILLLQSAHDVHADVHRRFLQEEEGHDDHSGESEVAWKFGAAFLGGFVLPLVLSSVFPHAPEHEPVQCPVCDANESAIVDGSNNRAAAAAVPMEVATAVAERSLGDTNTATPSCAEEGCAVCDGTGTGTDDDEEVEYATDPEDVAPVKTEKVVVDETPELAPLPQPSMPRKSLMGLEKGKPINFRLCASLLLGDFFHNFADGIFIGNAFLLCTNSVAWAIAAATIYHELAQELADFFLLTTQAHLPVWKALVLNFVSGLSVLLGVVVILSFHVSVVATGTILAISGGVYVYLAASECLPRIEKEIKSFKSRMISVACFMCGAIPIGLVLLNHGHCAGH